MKKLLILIISATLSFTPFTEAKHTDSLVEKMDQCETYESFAVVARTAMKNKKIKKHNCREVLAMVLVACAFGWSKELLEEYLIYCEKQGLIKYLDDNI